MLPLGKSQIAMFDFGLVADCCLGDSCLRDNDGARNFFLYKVNLFLLRGRLWHTSASPGVKELALLSVFFPQLE